MENKGHKLDNLFKEKLSDMEIPLEEDYWPFIEKSLDAPVTSFYKFGWKHFNIYHLCVSILLLFGIVYLFNKPKEKEKTPNNSSIEQLPSKDTIKSSSTLQEKVIPLSQKQNSAVNKNSVTKPNEIREEATTENNSIENIISKEEIVIPTAEPAKIVVEEKPKPKRIIYVIQQDTIIEKDTIKVRRKRKN